MELTRVTATGTVKATGTIVKTTIVTAAAAAASVVLRSGGAGGTVILTVGAPIGSTAQVLLPDGVTFATDIHATVAGAGAEVYVGY